MRREAVRAVVADNLRAARARTRLKQEEVAAAMRERGFDTWSRVTVSEVERYKRAVSVEELVELADVFGTSFGELLRAHSITGHSVESGVAVSLHGDRSVEAEDE